ncbi:hypothetical protein GCM10023317_90250 [Actinopolymorpha pittospori]
MQIAAAAPIAAEDTIGQTPPALGWIGLQDSLGISLWNYELSLDRGGMTSPDKFFWASITDSCWGAYRSWCALSVWFLDWVLSFSWVTTIASPLLAVGDAMQEVVRSLGLVPTFLTLTALLAGLWMLKGRYAAAIWEVGIACVIAALASGVFAQPVEMIAGKDGFVVKANQTGQELAAELATGDAEGKTPEQLRKAQTGQLVDTFIRQPTQMINFGRIIDGTKSEGAYNEVIKGGPYGTESNIRDRVGDCDKALGDYAANPSSAMAIGSVVFMPAAFVILCMALILAGSVIAAAVWAMFQSLKAIITMVTGLLPSGSRGSLLLTVAETLVALLLIIFTSVFLGVFLLVIQAMFAGSSGASMPRTFVVVDILIVVGTAAYWRQRRQLKAATQRLAQWMSQRPGGAPATRMPDRQPGLSLGSAATAVRTVTSLAQVRAQRAMANRDPVTGGPTFIDNRRQAAMFFGGLPRSGGPTVVEGEVVPTHGPGGPGRLQLPPGPDNPQLLPGPDNPQLPPGGSGGRGGAGPRPRLAGARRKIAGTLVRAGTSAALAYTTGGASSVLTGASKAARAAQTAKRAALVSRMALASGKNAAGTNRPPLPSSSVSAGRPQGQVIQGEVVSSRLATGPGKTPTPQPGKRNPASGKDSPTAPARSDTQQPSAPAPSATGKPRSQATERAARLQARLAERRAGRRAPGGK